MDGAVRWVRRLPASAWVFDSVLALVAAGLALFVSMPVGSGLPRGGFALGYGLVLLHTLPLAGRRRFPGTVLALVMASGLAGAALGLPPFFLGPAILVAVYSVAAYGRRWVSLAGLTVAELGLAALQHTLFEFGSEGTEWVGFMGILAAAWLLGLFAHNYRAYAARLEERTTELEQAREELARRAVTEERLRLARELHDVVAHAMSVIAVQSGVGAHVANTQPKEAAKALSAIEATSRAALTELRRLLVGVGDQAPAHPQHEREPVRIPTDIRQPDHGVVGSGQHQRHRGHAREHVHPLAPPHRMHQLEPGHPRWLVEEAHRRMLTPQTDTHGPAPCP
jgi:signal transduction histidine kinase